MLQVASAIAWLAETAPSLALSHSSTVRCKFCYSGCVDSTPRCIASSCENGSFPHFSFLRFGNPFCWQRRKRCHFRCRPPLLYFDISGNKSPQLEWFLPLDYRRVLFSPLRGRRDWLNLCQSSTTRYPRREIPEGFDRGPDQFR